MNVWSVQLATLPEKAKLIIYYEASLVLDRKVWVINQTSE